MKKNLKKLFALLLVVVMVAAMFAGCANNAETPCRYSAGESTLWTFILLRSQKKCVSPLWKTACVPFPRKSSGLDRYNIVRIPLNVNRFFLILSCIFSAENTTEKMPQLCEKETTQKGGLSDSYSREQSLSSPYSRRNPAPPGARWWRWCRWSPPPPWTSFS